MSTIRENHRRLPFTLAYAFSLLATVYTTIIAPSYLLTLLCTVVQLISLASFLVSYVPGGISFLTMVKDQVAGFFWSFFGGRGGSSILPL